MIRGVKPGDKNRNVSKLRESITDFVNDNYEEFVATWQKIKDPDKKCRTYIDLMKFVLPALSSVSIEQNTTMTITAKLQGLRLQQDMSGKTMIPVHQEEKKEG